MASIEGIKEELASTVLDAVRCLPISKQAAILLDTSLSLIETGQCAVLRLSLSTLGLSLLTDMGTRLKIFSRSTSRSRDCRKRT